MNYLLDTNICLSFMNFMVANINSESKIAVIPRCPGMTKS